MADNILLKMKNISKSFPGVKALDKVNLELKSGEVHALLGENGAGKSTLIKVLGGIYSLDEGEIEIEGKKVSIESVHDASKNNIAIIHQELVLVPYMTVAENIYLGRESGKGFTVNISKMEKDAQKILDDLGMDIDARELVMNLPIAKQQMVEITKAVSVNAKILVMDEPTSSISDREVENLFNIMRDLTKKGVGIIYISHKMSELEEICDRVTVMRDGEYVGTKVVKETNKDELIAMMVGRTLTNYYVRDFMPSKEVILKVENLKDGDRVKDVSFELKKGEIIGFAGLVGAGRSEAMQAIFGLSKDVSGDIYIEGKKVNIKNPTDAIKNGLALVPESRKEQGLYLLQDIKYNTTIEVLDEFIKNLNVNSKKESEITQKYIDMMATKTPSQEQVIGNLSGGNQQKVMIGRWLATNPKILILDEPTAPLSNQETKELFEVVNHLHKTENIAILFISHRLNEVLGICQSYTVMRNGNMIGTYPISDSTTTKEIVELMLGRSFEEAYRREETALGETIFEIQGLNEAEGRLKDINLYVRKGEILGIGGLVGAGKSELCKTLFGAYKSTGKIVLNGKELKLKNPANAVKNKIALVPEERRKEGVLIEETVSFNLSAAALDKFCDFSFVNRKKVNDNANNYINSLKVSTPSAKQSVKKLSGGNQQKVAVGKWLAADCELYIFDEPTKGVDVGAKQDIFHLIHEIAGRGNAVIYATCENQELLALTDRIYVMYSGQISAELNTKDTNEDEIMYYSVGEKQEKAEVG